MEATADDHATCKARPVLAVELARVRRPWAPGNSEDGLRCAIPGRDCYPSFVGRRVGWPRQVILELHAYPRLLAAGASSRSHRDAAGGSPKRVAAEHFAPLASFFARMARLPATGCPSTANTTHPAALTCAAGRSAGIEAESAPTSRHVARIFFPLFIFSWCRARGARVHALR